MIILDLVLKSHWYEMIRSGKKLAEFREVKPYWTKRLFNRPYTHVRFRRGYTKEAIVFEISGIELTTEANDLKMAKVYKITLGARIERQSNG